MKTALSASPALLATAFGLRITFLSAILCLFTTMESHAAAGDLDPSFGTGGKVTTVSSHNGFYGIYAAAIDASGRILATGTVGTGTEQSSFAVTRYTSLGELDTSFGIDGKVKTDFPGFRAVAKAIAIDADGMIVVAGLLNSGTSVRAGGFALARYTTTGVLDSSFGTNGKVFTEKTGVECTSVAIDGNGRILLGGYCFPALGVGNTDKEFCLVCYTPTGALDATFSTGGIVTTDFYGDQDIANSLVIQTDGKIIVAGQAFKPGVDGETWNFGLARYTSTGALDPTFGTGGKVSTDFDGGSDGCAAVVIDANDNIVLAGFTFQLVGQGNRDFGLARYTSSGILDPTFGTGGKVVTDLFGSWDFAYSATIEANGKILVSGSTGTSGTSQLNGNFALVRYTQTGALDPTFGTGGIVNTDFLGDEDAARSVTLDANGNILVAGFATDPTADASTRRRFALARYLSNSPPGISLKIEDTPVSSGGSYTFPMLPPGQQSSATVTITNSGTSPLTGITPSISPPGSDYQLGVTPPADTLPAGASTTFSVVFSPQASGIHTATLNVTSDAVPSPYVIQLTGSGGNANPPEITVEASDFYGDCDDAATDIATYLGSHGGAQASSDLGGITWTNDYNGTLPPCKGYVTVTFTATNPGGGSATTSSRFFLFPPGAVWVGPATGDWSTASGWNNGTLPTELLDTYIDLFDFQNSSVRLPGTGSVKNLFIGQGDSLLLGYNGASSSLQMNDGLIQNDGQITLGPAAGSGASYLYVNGAVSLEGTGKIRFEGNGTRLILPSNPSLTTDVLTIGADQEITTDAGTIGLYYLSSIRAGLVNQGKLTADEGGLNLYSLPKTNHGTFRAINGGVLRMEAPIDNSDGELFAGASSVLDLQSALTGGTVSGQGLLRVNSSAATVIGPITLGSELTTAVESTLTLNGTITHDGLLTLGKADGTGASSLYVNGAVSLEGTGKIRFQGSGTRRILLSNPSLTTDVLTIGADQEITTDAGNTGLYYLSSIYAGLVNEGTLTADGGGLNLYSLPKLNHGTFRAINGGVLRMESLIDNTDGELFADASSVLDLQSALTGGTVSGQGLLRVNSSAATFSGPLALGSELTTAVESTLTLNGTITHDGLLTLGKADGTGASSLYVNGAVSLEGTGKIRFQGNGTRRILLSNPSLTTDVLTIGADQEITTDAGTIGLYYLSSIYAGLVNEGTLTADGGGLHLYSLPKTNHGTFRAINGGSLVSITGILSNYNATTDTLAGGRWEVVSQGTSTLMDLQSSPIVTIAPDTVVCLSGADASFPQLSGLTTIAGTFCLENGKTFTTVGNLTVSGTLQFGLGDGATQGFDSQRLIINGNVDFSGSHIDVRSLGTTPGLYEIANWTGTATGTPVLNNVPLGLRYELVFDPVGKTLKVNVEGVPGGELKVIGIHYAPATGTTTIDYLSQPGVAHQVRGTSDFLNYDDLPDTEVGTGALMEYIHVSPDPPTKYFYKFSTQP